MFQEHSPKVTNQPVGNLKDPTDPQIESIYSCDQCEFDTDRRGDLEKHNSRNIHNVENKNKTLQDDDEEQSDHDERNQKMKQILRCSVVISVTMKQTK